MMIRSAFLLSSVCGTVVAIGENHQHGGVSVHGLNSNRQGMKADQRLLDDTFGVGELESILELLEPPRINDMSMSFQYTPTPSQKPLPHKTPMPTPRVKPSSKPSEGPTSPQYPSFTPVATRFPSVAVKSMDSTSPSGSTAPSFLPTPSGSSATDSLAPVARADADGAYQCANGGIVHVDMVGGANTLIHLKVTYAVDVRGTAISALVLTELESALTEAAIAAALGCATSGRRYLEEQHRALLTSTNKIGSCDSAYTKASCFVLETEMVFVLNKEANPEDAEYVSYVAIRDGMSSDIFVDNSEAIHQLTYLAPLPLVAPTSNSQPLEEEPASNGGNNNRVPLWIIGACVAVVTGGFVGMGAFLYKRRRAAQQEQKKQPSEVAVDSVSESPSGESLFSADGDYIEDIY